MFYCEIILIINSDQAIAGAALLNKGMKKEGGKTQKEVLIENADDIIEMLENGATYEDIKQKYKVRIENVSLFINAWEFSARARDAMKNSAQKYAKLALDSLLAIKTGDDKADITRQRELAHHYRWLAKVKAPKEFNENRVDTDELVSKLLAPTIILKKE